MKTAAATTVRPANSFFAKLRELANEALRLHLQNCQTLADALRHQQ